MPPVIDSQSLPDVLTANQGMNVKMLCSVVQGDPPISLRWFRGGNVVSRSASVSLQSLEDSSVLTLKGVVMRDSGNYTCVASNRAQAVNKSVTLVVNGRLNGVLSFYAFYAFVGCLFLTRNTSKAWLLQRRNGDETAAQT